MCEIPNRIPDLVIIYLALPFSTPFPLYIRSYADYTLTKLNVRLELFTFTAGFKLDQTIRNLAGTAQCLSQLGSSQKVHACKYRISVDPVANH